LWDPETGETYSSTNHRIGWYIIGRILNASDGIYDKTKIGRKRSPSKEKKIRSIDRSIENYTFRYRY
jgi:hypothetical protein